MDTGPLVETRTCAGGGCFSASRAGNLIKVEERRICEILKENLKEEYENA